MMKISKSKKFYEFYIAEFLTISKLKIDNRNFFLGKKKMKKGKNKKKRKTYVNGIYSLFII